MPCRLARLLPPCLPPPPPTSTLSWSSVPGHSFSPSRKRSTSLFLRNKNTSDSSTPSPRGGLKAAGRSGLSQGQLVILVYAPWTKIVQLVQNERHSDFLLGLPFSSLPSLSRDFGTEPLSPAERLRLVHSYVTFCGLRGGSRRRARRSGMAAARECHGSP